MSKRYEKALSPKELAARPDQEIDFSDIPELDAAFFQTAKKVMPNVSLRVPADVVEFFKSDNPKGYTARMAAVLVAFAQAHQSDR